MIKKATVFTGALLMGLGLWASSILAQGTAIGGGGGDTTWKDPGTGAAALTNRNNTFVAPYTNTFNGQVLASNITVYGTIIANTLIAQTITNTSMLETNLTVVGPATFSSAVTVTPAGAVTNNGSTVLSNLVVRGTFESVGLATITNVPAGALPTAVPNIAQMNASNALYVALSSGVGYLVSNQTWYGMNIWTNLSTFGASMVITGHVAHVGPTAVVSVGTNDAASAKLLVRGMSNSLTNAPLVKIIGSSERNTNSFEVATSSATMNLYVDKAGNTMVDRNPTLPLQVATMAYVTNQITTATNAFIGSSINIVDGIYGSNAILNISNATFLGTVAIPGNSADVNYIWTCTNATSGLGQWKASASSSGITNVIEVGNGSNLFVGIGSQVITNKTLVPGSNITITDSGTNLTIASTATGGGTPTPAQLTAWNPVAYGAVYTKIPILDSVATNTGETTYWTYTTNASKGTYVTIKSNGVYSITSQYGGPSPGSVFLGISKNTSSNDACSEIYNLPFPTNCAMTVMRAAAAGMSLANVSVTIPCLSNDVIYPIHNAAETPATPAWCSFTITRIGN